jgi:hypothetical protein
MRNLLFLGLLFVAEHAAAEKPLTNEDVLSLVEVGMDESLVLAKINQAPNVSFDVSAEALIGLKKAGVTSEILKALVVRADDAVQHAPVQDIDEGPLDAGEALPTQSKVSKLGGFWLNRKTVDRAGSCPDPGTVVEFIRVSSPGTSHDFAGCDVTTSVAFVGMGTGNMVVPGIPKGWLVFRAAVPGVQAETDSPFGVSAGYIALGKEYSDTVLALRAGDHVRLRGASRVNKILMGGGGFETILFLASNIKAAAR